ncbi:MAG: DUF6054 family protein [Eubacteriales bacterium]|nr:DUF6054 family protein [Eubacteriales bacterium]
MAQSFFVKTDLRTAADVINTYIVTGSISGECVDRYRIPTETGAVEVMVFEKYYYRVGNRLSLTVVLDDLTGVTRVRSIGSGGGNGVFLNFDWGSADSFAASPYQALRDYL